MNGIIDMARRALRLGPAEVARRALRRLSARLDVDALSFPLLGEDIADSTRPEWWSKPGRSKDPTSPAAVVGWVCTPPSAGSGGHTTLFRMVEGLEGRGLRCVLFLYDRYDGDLAAQAAVLRQNWPSVKAEIRDARGGIRDVDVAIASSWETAHVLASRATEAIPLLYFIQDFEPYFYPRGSLYALAEDSYRFGFSNIALGEMVAGELRRNGIDSTTAPFGCDVDVYSRSNAGARKGVVFYAKPGADRRGFILARAALEDFHRRHPEQPIHVYGTSNVSWPFPVINHGRLTPAGLNALYNESLAGLAMSFTNISLVAEELLASGVIPIVNDSPLARADLDNPETEWAIPTAGGVSDALCRVVENPHWQLRSARAAASARRGWGPAQQVVADLVDSVILDWEPRR